MNIKKTANAQLSTTESQTNKQKTKTGTEFTGMEITWRVISGEGNWGEWGKRYRKLEV